MIQTKDDLLSSATRHPDLLRNWYNQCQLALLNNLKCVFVRNTGDVLEVKLTFDKRRSILIFQQGMTSFLLPIRALVEVSRGYSADVLKVLDLGLAPSEPDSGLVISINYIVRQSVNADEDVESLPTCCGAFLVSNPLLREELLYFLKVEMLVVRRFWNSLRARYASTNLNLEDGTPCVIPCVTPTVPLPRSFTSKIEESLLSGKSADIKDIVENDSAYDHLYDLERGDTKVSADIDQASDAKTMEEKKPKPGVYYTSERRGSAFVSTPIIRPKSKNK